MPNLLGLALGKGGETETLRAVLSGVLVARGAALLRARLAPAGRDHGQRLGDGRAAGDAQLGAAWYVLWVLPLAALSSSRRLRTTALVLGVYLIVAWAPASGLLWNTIGFHPEKTSLGRLHQRYVKELLN